MNGNIEVAPPFKKTEILEEYDESSLCEEEFRKVKWGSAASMINRHTLAAEQMPLAKGVKWLDIGCGTGGLQEIGCRMYPGVEAIGIDLNRKLIEFARKKNILGATFRVGDFWGNGGGQFEVISAIGVVQKLNYPLRLFCVYVSKLLKEGGCLYLDTKNRNWSEFSRGRLEPEPIHDWFTESELLTCLKDAGFLVTFISGFLSEENAIVPVNQSHTIVVRAVKTNAKSESIRNDDH